MSARSVLVQPVSSHAVYGGEKRISDRHVAQLEALTRPLDAQDTLWWGATVRDISQGGIGLTLCYPFRLGTFLAVDLQSVSGVGKTLLTRVVHVQDQPDGTWQVGCEFVKKLSESDLDLVL